MMAFQPKILALLALAACTCAQAGWPEKPIRVIVPFSAGGPPDVVLRSVQDEVAKVLGQPLVIDNREGAAGNIGVTLASQASADGYTLLLASSGNFTVNQHLYRSFKIDPLKAFAPVIHLYEVPAVLVSSTSVPAVDFKAFVAYAKSRKGSTNFGSPGYGTTPHIALETLSRALDLDMTGVTYRGAPPVVTALVAGDIQVAFAVAGAAVPFVKSGKMQPLAVASEKRIPLLPEVPTFRELGWPHVANATPWLLVAPAGTPDAILERLNAVLRQAIMLPETRRRLEDLGITPVGGVRREAGELLAREASYWRGLIKEQGIKPLD